MATDATVTNGTARILWVQSPTTLIKFPPLVTVIVKSEDVEPVGYALVGPFAPFVADGSVTYELPTFVDRRFETPTPPALATPQLPESTPAPTPEPTPEPPTFVAKATTTARTSVR